jgi:hypothetical protein
VEAIWPRPLFFNDLIRRLGHSSRRRHHYQLVMEGVPEHTKIWKSICVRKAINENETHNRVHYLLISWQISRSVGNCSREMLSCCRMRSICSATIVSSCNGGSCHKVLPDPCIFSLQIFTVHRYYQELCTVNSNISEKHSFTTNFLTRCIIPWLQIWRNPLEWIWRMFWYGSSTNDTQTSWCDGQIPMTQIFFYVCTPLTTAIHQCVWLPITWSYGQKCPNTPHIMLLQHPISFFCY